MDDNSNPPPAGIDDLPVDLQDSPVKEDEGALAYTLQNFNALVAANTAMQTEISSLTLKVTAAEGESAHLREVIAESLKPAIATLTKVTDDQEKLIQKHEIRARNNESELQFARDQRDVLQRRLDRTMGFVDRVLDEEASLRAPTKREVPTQAPSVGPDLSSIPGAVRRDAEGRDSMSYAYGEPLRTMSDPSEPQRRY